MPVCCSIVAKLWTLHFWILYTRLRIWSSSVFKKGLIFIYNKSRKCVLFVETCIICLNLSSCSVVYCEPAEKLCKKSISLFQDKCNLLSVFKEYNCPMNIFPIFCFCDYIKILSSSLAVADFFFMELSRLFLLYILSFNTFC